MTDPRDLRGFNETQKRRISPIAIKANRRSNLDAKRVSTLGSI
jgi:hypothetical protein